MEKIEEVNIERFSIETQMGVCYYEREKDLKGNIFWYRKMHGGELFAVENKYYKELEEEYQKKFC